MNCRACGHEKRLPEYDENTDSYIDLDEFKLSFDKLDQKFTFGAREYCLYVCPMCGTVIAE